MDSNSTSMATNVMMVPYLHFTGGDYLFFKSLRPSSAGALAGASLVLFLLALLERGLAACRCSLELHWSNRTSTADSPPGSLKDSVCISEQPVLNRTPERGPLLGQDRSSKLRPFIAAHDIPRGIVQAAQSLLGYFLMLAVMTFQVAFIISIVVGLGVGETIFGRFLVAGGHAGH